MFVFDGIGIGGIERVGVDYVNLLAEKGHNVYVINLNPKRTELVQEISDRCTIRAFKFSRSIVYYRYQKLVENGFWGILGYLLLLIILTPVSYFAKLLFRLNNLDVGSFDCLIAMSGHYNDLFFTANNYANTKNKVAWLHGAEFEYGLLSGGYFSLYKRIKNLVCLSEMCDSVCQSFNKRYSIKKTKIYNPIKINDRVLNEYLVQELKNKYQDFALMVGRMNKDKDQETVIRAMRIVNSQYAPKHLLFVGDGPSRGKLELLVKELNMDEYIHFIGNQIDVQNYYEAAAIYVHSSPMEGLPTVLLEAMSYKKPIASTDSIPGVREILGNEDCGLISPVGDAVALANNIIRLYEDYELKMRLINRGQIRIKDFQPEKSITALEKFLNFEGKET